ncbi:unnamed protein product [Lathyrus sativus]|nr:unnamed protein product [Lathyrus sativus]
MTDFQAINPLSISATDYPRFPFLNSHPTPSTRTQLKPIFLSPFSPKSSKTTYANNIVSAALSSSFNGRPGPPSKGHSFYKELQFDNTTENDFELELELERNPIDEGSSKETDGSIPLDENDDKGSGKRENEMREDDLIRVCDDGEGDEGVDLRKDDKVEKFGGNFRLRKGKQVIRAKQVISIQSALSLGFVSQFWVDTTSVSK